MSATSMILSTSPTASRTFTSKYEKMEATADRPLSDYTLDELETLWQQAKAQLAKHPNETSNRQQLEQ